MGDLLTLISSCRHYFWKAMKVFGSYWKSLISWKPLRFQAGVCPPWFPYLHKYQSADFSSLFVKIISPAEWFLFSLSEVPFGTLIQLREKQILWTFTALGLMSLVFQKTYTFQSCFRILKLITYVAKKVYVWNFVFCGFHFWMTSSMFYHL